jgi:hypothetical protein
MAQRMVHYLFGVLLAETMEPADRGRFLLGSLLPDAYLTKPEREITHYTGYDAALDMKWYDFGRFYRCFSQEVRTDPLYLGYYLHIVEDDLHRQILHGGEIRVPRNDREVELLYRDYHILNRRLRLQYDLRDELILPPEFASLPINRQTPLDAAGMIEALRADLADETEGPLTMLPEGLTEAFISDSLSVLRREMRAVLQTGPGLNARDIMWKRHERYN